MIPLTDRALENRSNPKGIPYLYVATDKETAMSETRPWQGAILSVARFKISHGAKLVDCSQDTGARDPVSYVGASGIDEPDPSERERVVWRKINEAFSRPVDRGDDAAHSIADYAPTQIIAELFRSNGYNGLKYRSSVSTSGHNIVLFDLKAVKLFSRRLFTVHSINYQFREHMR
jgi:RES domain-containing protein